MEWCFGAITMFLGLAFIATIPILQFISLGYLLETSGRVSRSGRLRDGFIGIRPAARVGSMVLGTVIWWGPLFLISDTWYASYLIQPHSTVTRGWFVTLLLSCLLIIGHVLWAWFRGGRLRSFFWPAPLKFIKRMLQGGLFTEARDDLWNFVRGLQLQHFFWLGLRGFAGAVAWLFIPILFFIGATTLPAGAAAISGLIGFPLFMFVLLYLPFLQAHFAAENRLEAIFEWGEIRQQFRRAPIALWFALAITLLFALPLYLLKIELIPREATMLPNLVFVAFIFPARLMTGWALGRARRHQTPRFWLSRWLFRLAGLPLVAGYVFIVFFTRFTSWYGVWSMFEQHAFLVPAPFLGF